MRRTLAAVLSVLLLTPSVSVADEQPQQPPAAQGLQPDSQPEAAQPTQPMDLGVEQPLPAPQEQAPGIVGNGGWLFADSPYVASTLQPVVISRFTYAAHTSITRPFGSNVGNPGGATELGGELGLGAGFSVQATAVAGTSYVDMSSQVGGMAGIRFSALPRSWEHWQLVLNAGWIHELSGDDGVYTTIQAGFTTGPLRAQVSIHGEHIFAADRDALDLYVSAGAAVKLLSFFSLGVEYMGQDLEAMFIADGDDAEGGARHLLGPTLAFAFLDDKLSIVAGPAYSFGQTGTYWMGRFALSYGF